MAYLVFPNEVSLKQRVKRVDGSFFSSHSWQRPGQVIGEASVQQGDGVAAGEAVMEVSVCMLCSI